MVKIKIRHESLSESNNDRSDKYVHKKKSETIKSFISRKHYIFGVYIVSGALILIFLFTLYDIYILHLKVETAVVNAPLQILAAPVSGYIQKVNVSEGDHVYKGDILMKLENIEMERSASLARLKVEENRLNVNYLQALLAIEQKKMNLYKMIEQHKLSSLDSSYEVSKKAMEQSKSNLVRIKSLKSRHFASEADFEKAMLHYKISRSEMLKSFTDKKIEDQSFHAIEDGMYFTGEKLEGNMNDISARIEAANAQLALDQKRYEIHESLLEKENLHSPFDAEIIDVYKSSGNTTNGMEPIILLMQEGAHKTITAWLTQSEITHIRLSSMARIYLPSKNIFFHGKVARVNRNSGFLDEIKAQFRWRDLQIDRSASVVIEIEPNESGKFNSYAIPGMPAIVYFKKA